MKLNSLTHTRGALRTGNGSIVVMMVSVHSWVASGIELSELLVGSCKMFYVKSYLHTPQISFIANVYGFELS